MGYREQLNECTDPVSGDWLEITDVSVGSTDKDRKLNVGRFALLAGTSAFTAAQTFTQPATGSSAITITPIAAMSAAPITISSINNTSSFGPFLSIGRNSNGTTPASGFIRLVGRTGNSNDIWADASASPGVLRIGNGTTTTTDTGGSIVGAQTSWVEFKTDIVEWDTPQQALDAVLACKLFRYHFKGDATKRQYAGLVITEADRGAWFSENDGPEQIPALNERNLFGYLIASIQALQAQVDELKQKVDDND